MLLKGIKQDDDAIKIKGCSRIFKRLCSSSVLRVLKLCLKKRSLLNEKFYAKKVASLPFP
uniref:Uncharacterized protein n=1 Tax=Romanomermis culicivorax TaxID=13658 RepID=A0A915HL14_ROMCU